MRSCDSTLLALILTALNKFVSSADLVASVLNYLSRSITGMEGGAGVSAHPCGTPLVGFLHYAGLTIYH